MGNLTEDLVAAKEAREKAGAKGVVETSRAQKEAPRKRGRPPKKK